MITVKRKIYNHLNVIDKVYKDNILQFEQSNLSSKNRFKAKEFKCNNGKVLTVGSWDWVEKD